VPGLLSGNGMAWVDQRLLIADSLLGLVLSIDPSIDPARGRSSVWLVDELLTKTDPASPLPGVNGVAAGHESHVGTFRKLARPPHPAPGASSPDSIRCARPPRSAGIGTPPAARCTSAHGGATLYLLGPAALGRTIREYGVRCCDGS